MKRKVERDEEWLVGRGGKVMIGMMDMLRTKNVSSVYTTTYTNEIH